MDETTLKLDDITAPAVPERSDRIIVRVLQTSDWHVGSELKMLSPQRAQLRREELFSAIAALPEFAKRNQVQVVLLPGDLFQHEDVSIHEVERLTAVLNAFEPLPVVIAAGNHDPFHVLSHYNKQLAAKRLRGAGAFNDHVFIAGAEWQRFEFNGFAVTARSFASHARQTDNPLVGIPPRGRQPIELLCLHASLGDAPEDQLRISPLDEAELFSLGYDYAALGHYHRASAHQRGELIAAGYSGSIGVFRKSDTGETGITILDVQWGGVLPSNRRQVKVDRCRIVSVNVELNGPVENLPEIVKKQLLFHTVTASDYVRLKLTGKAPVGSYLLPKLEDVSDICFGLDVDNQIRPDWDFETLSQGNTTEAVFVRRMRERIADAEQRGDADTARQLADALDIGLQALKYGKISQLPS